MSKITKFDKFYIKLAITVGTAFGLLSFPPFFLGWAFGLAICSQIMVLSLGLNFLAALGLYLFLSMVIIPMTFFKMAEKLCLR